ncbi:MAG: hypothetical protein V1652_01150 [bacterium]
MKNNFPNSLIFIIAAGVIFVAGSYVLFGINESTGKPRVFNWVPYSYIDTKEQQNGHYQVIFETSIGDITIETAPSDKSSGIVAETFVSYLKKIHNDTNTSFVFDNVEYDGFIHASLQKKISIQSNGATSVFPRGTVAVLYEQDGTVSDFIILLDERTLPEKYVPVGNVVEDDGTVSSIGLLPRNSCNALLSAVSINKVTVQQVFNGDQNSVTKGKGAVISE